MFSKDRMTIAFYLSAIIVGIIDVISIIAFITFMVLISIGVLLSSKTFIILAVILAAINILELLMIPFYLNFRKD